MLKVIAIGRLKDKNLASKCDEYLKRLTRFAKVELLELKDSDVAEEGARILKSVAAERGLVLALGEEGEAVTSEKFAALLGSAERKVSLIIGGAYGLSAEVKGAADRLISLSPMTFTHELARLILFEQLYRAATILNNVGYHH